VSSTLETARADIEGAIETAWAAQTSVQYGDRPFAIPASGQWLRVSVLWGDATPFTIGGSGSGLNRVLGIVDGSLFAARNAGLGQAVQYADDLRNALSQKVHGIVTFGVCSGPEDVTHEGDAYHHLTVTAPFHVMETV
jgi:hypothetical protein